MHYKDGTPAALGDIVKGKEYGVEIVGVVQSVSPGSTTCNMSVGRLASICEQDGRRVVIATGRLDTITATCKDYLKIAALLIAVSLQSMGAAASAQTPAAPPPPQVDTAEIGRWGDRVVVAGEGPRDGGEALYSQAMAPPEDDSDQWYITVYGSSRDAASLGVVKGFERDPNLAHFTATPPGQKRPWAHFNFYQVDDSTQRFRFAQGQIATTGPWPIITIQPPRKGTFGDPRVVVDRIEPREIGKPEELRKRIQASVALYCRKLQQTARLERPGGHQQAAPEGAIGGPASFPWGPDVPPAVPQVNPQWPSGGPAADQAPSLIELEAACPGAPADFLMAQLRAKASAAAAQAAWQFLKSKLLPEPKAPVVAPVTPAESGSLWLKIVVALLGSQMVGQFAGKFLLPYVKGRQEKAATTASPFDDLLFGFVRKALEQRLNVEPNAKQDSLPSGA